MNMEETNAFQRFLKGIANSHYLKKNLVLILKNKSNRFQSKDNYEKAKVAIKRDVL